MNLFAISHSIKPASSPPSGPTTPTPQSREHTTLPHSVSLPNLIAAANKEADNNIVASLDSWVQRNKSAPKKSPSIENIKSPAEKRHSTQFISFSAINDAILEDCEDYDLFLEKLISSKHLRLTIESFIQKFERKVPPFNEQKDIINTFIESTKPAIMADPQWTSLTDKQVTRFTLRNLRHFLMRKLYNSIFYTEETLRKDFSLSKKMKILDFVQPSHLDLLLNKNDELWDLCVQALLKINYVFLPREKLDCLLNLCKLISKYNFEKQHQSGADVTLPSLIYTTILSQVPFLGSNLSFISRFCEDCHGPSEESYYLTQFESAAYFIETANASLLRIPEEEYEGFVKKSVSQAKYQKIHVVPTDREKLLEQLSESERKKYLSPEEKALEERFPLLNSKFKDLDAFQLEHVFNEYKLLLRNVSPMEQLGLVDAMRAVKVVRIKEKGASLYQKMKIPRVCSLKELKHLVTEKLCLQGSSRNIEEIVVSGGFVVKDDEDVQLIEEGQQIEISMVFCEPHVNNEVTS